MTFSVVFNWIGSNTWLGVEMFMISGVQFDLTVQIERTSHVARKNGLFMKINVEIRLI